MPLGAKHPFEIVRRGRRNMLQYRAIRRTRAPAGKEELDKSVVASLFRVSDSCEERRASFDMARDNGPPLLENPKSILDGMTHRYTCCRMQ